MCVCERENEEECVCGGVGGSEREKYPFLSRLSTPPHTRRKSECVCGRERVGGWGERASERETPSMLNTTRFSPTSRHLAGAGARAGHPERLLAVLKPETRNPKPETRNPKSEIQNPKPETRNPSMCVVFFAPRAINPHISLRQEKLIRKSDFKGIYYKLRKKIIHTPCGRQYRRNTGGSLRIR